MNARPVVNEAEHVRFLVAMPLLLLCEPFVDARLGVVVDHFTRSGVVPAERAPGLAAALAWLGQRRESAFAELVVLGLAYGMAAASRATALEGVHRDWLYRGETGASLAGSWFFWFSLPLYFFLLYRWLWRLLAWSLFLRRVSRLGLRLVATHPDRLGGLAFAARGQAVFVPVAFAVACVLSATLRERLVQLGALRQSAGHLVLLYVVVSAAVMLGPLLVFMPGLVRAKRDGYLRYGLLSSDYVRSFEDKWVKRKEATTEELLGTPDLQSLADLGNSFRVIQEMQVFPFDRKVVFAFAVIVAAPFLPLVLAEIPLEKLIAQLFGLVFAR